MSILIIIINNNKLKNIFHGLSRAAPLPSPRRASVSTQFRVESHRELALGKSAPNVARFDSPPENILTALHEAAHCCVAVWFGLPYQFATIVPQGLSAGAVYWPEKSKAHGRLGLSREIAIDIAGAVAEAYVADDPNPNDTPYNRIERRLSPSDRQLMNEHLDALGLHGLARREYLNHVIEETEKLIRSPKMTAAIGEVARKLMERPFVGYKLAATIVAEHIFS